MTRGLGGVGRGFKAPSHPALISVRSPAPLAMNTFRAVSEEELLHRYNNLETQGMFQVKTVFSWSQSQRGLLIILHL